MCGFQHESDTQDGRGLVPNGAVPTFGLDVQQFGTEPLER